MINPFAISTILFISLRAKYVDQYLPSLSSHLEILHDTIEEITVLSDVLRNRFLPLYHFLRKTSSRMVM